MSIPFAIIAAIAAAVDAMSVAGGYNFDHGPVDVRNPASWVYPQTFLEFPEGVPAPTEMVGKHTHAWALTFRSIVARGAGDIEAEASKVADDFIRMMDAQLTALQALGLLRYELEGFSRSYRLVYAAPCEIRVTFTLIYRQSRSNPSST